MQLSAFYNISKNDIFVQRNHFNRHLESGKTNSFAGLLDFFEYGNTKEDLIWCFPYLKSQSC